MIIVATRKQNLLAYPLPHLPPLSLSDPYHPFLLGLTHDEKERFIEDLEALLIGRFPPYIQFAILSSPLSPGLTKPPPWDRTESTIDTCFNAWGQKFVYDFFPGTEEETRISLEIELLRIDTAIRAAAASIEARALYGSRETTTVVATHRCQVSFEEASEPPKKVRTFTAVGRALQPLSLNAGRAIQMIPAPSPPL